MWTTLSIKESQKNRIELWAERMNIAPHEVVEAMLAAMDAPRYREIVQHFANVMKVTKKYDIAATEEEREEALRELARLKEMSELFIQVV